MLTKLFNLLLIGSFILATTQSAVAKASISGDVSPEERQGVDQIVLEFNSLNHTLTTKWDQKDELFKNKAIEDTTAKVTSIKDQFKLSDDQILLALTTAANLDQNTADKLSHYLAYSKSYSIPEEEKIQKITDILTNNQNTGASFDGDTVLVVLLVVGLIAVTIALLDTSSSASDGYGVGSDLVDSGSSDEPYYEWYCEAASSYYTYWVQDYYYDTARSGALSNCVSNTPSSDYCTITSCQKVY